MDRADIYSSPATLTAGRNIEALPANRGRYYLAVQNNTAEVLYVAYGRPATIKDWQIASGDSFEPKVAPVQSVNLFTPTGGDIVICSGNLLGTF